MRLFYGQDWKRGTDRPGNSAFVFDSYVTQLGPVGSCSAFEFVVE